MKCKKNEQNSVVDEYLVFNSLKLVFDKDELNARTGTDIHHSRSYLRLSSDLELTFEMVAISKPLFYELVQKKPFDCDLIHLWTSDCKRASFFSKYLVWNIALGSAKFFLPVYILKLLLTFKGKDKKILVRNFLVSEVRSIIYGIFMACLIICSICFFRISSEAATLEDKEILKPIYAATVRSDSEIIGSDDNDNDLELVIETLLRKININEKWNTLIFASISGLLMHMMANRRKKIDFTYFWIYTPPNMNDYEKSDSCCSHDNTCPIYLSEGFLKYFSLGYAVNAVKSILPRIGNLVKKPSSLMKIFFSKSNLYLGLFIGSYVGFYRILTCYLTRTSKIKKKFHGFIAGLFSGITYSISPNIQIVAIAMSTLLQLIHSNIAEYFNITNHFWQRHLLFVLCSGYLLQEKFFSPETCSPYYKKMIDACTNNVTQDIYKALIHRFFGTS